MNTEAGYGLKPQGHANMPLQDHVFPLQRLAETALRWLDHIDWRKPGVVNLHTFDDAREFMAGTDLSVPGLHALALDLRIQSHRDREHLGEFISAGYSLLNEPLVVFDLDASWLGGLAMQYAGIFINSGNCGHSLGYASSGVVINLGTAQEWAGQRSEGSFLNAGTVGNGMGNNSTGTMIEQGISGNYFCNPASGMVVWEEYDYPRFRSVGRSKVSARFQRYTQRLTECARTDPGSLIGQFGDASAINKKFEKLLHAKQRLEGYDV
jgi:hypothetical protein